MDWILTSASPTQQTEKRRFERVYDEDLSSGDDNPATRIHFAKRVRAREDSSDHIHDRRQPMSDAGGE